MGAVYGLHQLFRVRRGQLGGVGRRRRTQVCHIVGYGDVRLMAHGGYDRYLAVVDGPGHALVVEGPEVLHGAAAAPGYERVGHPVLAGVAYGRGYLRRGLRALHAHRQEDDLRHRPAPAQHADYVVHRRPRAAGNDRNALGIARNGLFMRRVEQALLFELGLELFVGDLQISAALRHQRLAVELIRPVARVHADAPVGRDAHAALRPEAQLAGRRTEHDALERALRVLEREIMVARGVDLVIGQLPAHGDRAQEPVTVHQRLYIGVELGDGQGIALLHSALSAPSCAPSPRIYPPSTPFMNDTVSGSSKFFASSTASLMATPGVTSLSSR